MTTSATADWKNLDITDEEIAGYVKVFRKKAKFLVDESLGEEFARQLRQFKYNVIDAKQAELIGRADDDYFALALREDRILLTHDDDFWDDRKFQPHSNAGLVVLPGASGSETPLVDSFVPLLQIIAPFRETWRQSKVQIKMDGKTSYLTVKGIDHTGKHYKSRYRMNKQGSWVWPNE